MILAFGAHPDDVELACSGTLIAHLAKGYQATIVDLTRGELGSRGSAEIRDRETVAASKIMGITLRENLQFRDGFFVQDEPHLMAVIQIIRKYQPVIVLANAESDRHVDHGRAGNLIHEACFLAGLAKIKTELEGKPQQAWRPKQVYHYIQDYYTKPNLVFDISPFFEKKMEAIMAYKSQFYNPDSKEPLTPISTPEFNKYLEGRAVEFGRLIGVQYGEGFTVKRPVGSIDLLQLI